MSKQISLKINDEIFIETERFTHRNHISRNAYINRAIRLMNRLQERRLLRNELRKESRNLRIESQDVLREFEEIQDEGL